MNEDIFSSLQARVNEEMNIELMKSFTKEGVLANLFNMHLNKAFSVDSFSAAFFQNYWDIIGNSVPNACLNFLNGEGMLGNLNHTVITLLPKVKEPKEVVDYKPISLCSVLYNVISKTIANRLKALLPSIISVEQRAFVPGRQILDNTLGAIETMYRIKSHKKGRLRLMALKLDMSKTYDKVEWDFLKAIMERMKFNRN